MKCPHCGHMFVPLEGQKFCSQCGGELRKGAEVAPSEEVPSDRQADAAYWVPTSKETGAYCPWEDLDHLGFFQGLVLTVQQSLFSPSAFFSRLPPRGGLLNPLLYALIMETVGTMGGYLTGITVENPLLPQAKLSTGLMIAVGILIPIGVVLSLFLWSVLLHVSLLLASGAKEDFEATFRVISYTSAADLFNIIPIIGSFVAICWKLYLLLIGVREIHRIGTGRAAAAIALPLLLCCGIIAAGSAIALMGIIGSAQ